MSRDSAQVTEASPHALYGVEPSYLLVDEDGDAVAVHVFEPVGDEDRGRVFLTTTSDLGGSNSVELSPADLIALGEHLTDLGEERS